jgi:hypothetical protein
MTRKEIQKRYRSNSKEYRAEWQRQWRKKHPEYDKEYNKKYRERHPRYNPDRRLKHEYGISLDEYDKMVENQEGVCAICKKPPIGRRLAVDHDHVTGKIRGLLCHNCNVSLGLLGEDSEAIKRLLDYLEKAKA